MSNVLVSNLTTTLRSIQWYFGRVALPTCFLLGNIGNTFNLIIFSQRSSRKNSCLLYFLFASVIDFFILNLLLVLRLVAVLWNNNPGQTSVWFCGWRTYFLNTLFLIHRSSVLLACIDRMCASSKNARIRQWSQPKIAYRMIAVSCIFWATVFIPNMVVPILAFGQCFTPPYSKFASYITASTLAPGILLPSGMLICGLVTFSHLKLMRSRVGAEAVEGNRERHVANQHVVLVFVQVLMDCLCNLLYPCYLIYTIIFPVPQATEMVSIYSFWQDMAFNLPYVNFSATFYLHTLSSPSFRRKLFQLVRKVGRFQTCCPHHDTNNTGATLSIMMTSIRDRTALNQSAAQ